MKTKGQIISIIIERHRQKDKIKKKLLDRIDDLNCSKY